MSIIICDSPNCGDSGNGHKKATEEKAVKKAAPATKKTSTGKSSAKKPVAKKAVNKPVETKDGFARVELGSAMPYYLL